MKFQLQDLNILALADSYNLEKFDPEVLREYDIRGIVDKNLTFNTAYTIGRTFGHIVCSQSTTGTIVVGYDGRLTSPKLHEVLCKGLVDTGIKVISILLTIINTIIKLMFYILVIVLILQKQ